MAAFGPPVVGSASRGIARPGWVRRHPLAAFVVLCFGLAWASLIPLAAESRAWLPFHLPAWVAVSLAGWGPAVAAFGVAAAVGRGHDLLLRTTRWRFDLRWYAVPLLGPAVAYTAAVWINTMLGGSPPGPGSLVVIVPLFGISLVVNCQEIGWRGFLLPGLLERYSPLEASLFAGLVWIAWHTPYLLWLGQPIASVPGPAFIVLALSSSVVLTWLYRRSGESTLPPLLFQATNTACGAALLLTPGEGRAFEVYAGLCALVAMLLAVTRRVPTRGPEPDGMSLTR
jgi:uncharacterized protein